MQILVLNCGSSSIKYQLIDMTGERVRARGLVERIGRPESSLTHKWDEGEFTEPLRAEDHASVLVRIRELLLDPERGGVRNGSQIAAVGHRVVHGGHRCVRSMLVTREVEEIIEQCAALAPLHNPPNLIGIRSARQFFPDASHVAVFDTAFHQSMPEQAFLYAIPHDLYREDHIRKYGFHGISHRYVAEHAAAMLGKKPEEFTGVTCHLGNGCSLTAIRDGRSVDTSMGLTPLEGAAMGERSGDVDPGLIFHLARAKAMTIDAIDHLLNHESGLLGLSGVSNDLREIHASAQEGNPRAEVAQKVFAYRIQKYIGAYLAVLGRADAVVMTGGIGENQAPMRKRIFEGLEGIGMELDPQRNDRCIGREGVISTDRSPIRLFVIPTNEELLIARDARDVIENSG